VGATTADTRAAPGAGGGGVSAFRPQRTGGAGLRPRQAPSGPARFDLPTPQHPADQIATTDLAGALHAVNLRRMRGETPTADEEATLAAAIASWRPR